MDIGIDVRPALKAKTGVGNYVINLVRALADIDRENRYHLFSNSFKDRFRPPRLDDRADWRLRDFRFPNLLMDFAWDRVGGSAIRRLLGGIDIFHFTGNIAPGLKGIATVASVYDLYHVRHPGSVAGKHRVSRRGLEKNLNSVSKIICISAFTKADLTELFEVPPGKISVVPLGVDSLAFQPMDKRECARRLKDRFQIESDFLLFVGTLETRKNLPALVEAFRRVRERRPDLQLVLAGDAGEGFARVREKIRQVKLDGAVRLLGYLAEDEDLKCLYGGAAAFVFPSHYEGFGLPLLEAFACGTPAAASDRTAIPEVAGDAALLFDPDRPEDIAGKILQILEDDSLARTLRDRGLARARAFSWSHTAQKTLEVYESLKGNPCG